MWLVLVGLLVVHGWHALISNLVMAHLRDALVIRSIHHFVVLVHHRLLLLRATSKLIFRKWLHAILHLFEVLTIVHNLSRLDRMRSMCIFFLSLDLIHKQLATHHVGLWNGLSAWWHLVSCSRNHPVKCRRLHSIWLKVILSILSRLANWFSSSWFLRPRFWHMLNKILWCNKNYLLKYNWFITIEEIQ